MTCFILAASGRSVDLLTKKVAVFALRNVIQTAINYFDQLLQLFMNVFGAGPATAKKWIKMGLSTIGDVISSDSFQTKDDSRLAVGRPFAKHSGSRSRVSYNLLYSHCKPCLLLV